jgi:hypothetical protein
MKKFYYVQSNVGKARYVVSHYDGVEQHNDGSPSYDITICTNKREFAKVISQLKKEGYVEKGRWYMTRENAKNLMSTAIESGIAYWMNDECIDVEVVSKDVMTPNRYYARVDFKFEGKKYQVSLADMVRLADKFIETFPHLPIEDMTYDSVSADAFFQYCAFGDIFFG